MYIYTFKIGHKFGRMISMLDELTLQKGIAFFVNNACWTKIYKKKTTKKQA